ncbi:CHAT domain-containing protein [Streptomyces sp. NPDC046931]|uniref:CHAT domain-containing protein n=1 Tax=Streptomyces sp. NPDC046931 TaxID=3154806 RepID=UPI0033DAF9B3
MSDAGAGSLPERVAAALARTTGCAVPFEPDSHRGLSGARLDEEIRDLGLLLDEARGSGGADRPRAALEARAGALLGTRFVLAGAPEDRVRALSLLNEARTSKLLDEDDRSTARRDLTALLGSRLTRLVRDTGGGTGDRLRVDQLMHAFAAGIPADQGGSGILEDVHLLLRLLQESDAVPAGSPDRAAMHRFGAALDAVVRGDLDGVVAMAEEMTASGTAGHVPQPMRALLPVLLGMLRNHPGQRTETQADTPDSPDDLRQTFLELTAMAEVMAPGSLAPEEIPKLLDRLSGAVDPSGAQTDGSPLSSRMIAAMSRFALGVRTGDMEEFREALKLMREASESDEFDARSRTEWLPAVVSGLLTGAALTGGSLQDQELADVLLEELDRYDTPTDTHAVTLRLCAECLRIQTGLGNALDSGDTTAVESLIDDIHELDGMATGADEWAGVFVSFLLGSAYLGLGSRTGRTEDVRKATHHLQHALEQTVDVPALRSMLDAVWAPLLALTAAVESDPGRIAEGIRRTRSVLARPGFTFDFEPRVRGAVAIALRMLHQLTGDPEPLDEAVRELEQARALLPPDGAPATAVVHWDLAQLLADRAGTRPGTPAETEDLLAAVAGARAALRASADEVLLQLGVRHGLRIARQGADRGRTAALWALRAGHPEEAVGCLEAGRSLVLGAAAVSVGVADRLAALGASELAGRWRAAVPARPAGPAATGGVRSPLELLSASPEGTPTLPGDVRRQSLALLRGQEEPVDEPPSATLTALRAGLTRTRADALVYLVPGTAEEDGAALLVTPGHPVEAVPLPALSASGRAPVTAYLEAGAHRQRLAASPDGEVTQQERNRADRAWLAALQGMCDWAGHVFSPVLDRLGLWQRGMAESGLARASGTEDHAPEAVRLVLVPCGELGVVPWHAAVVRPPARYGGPDTVRVCEIAVLTHAASGREFLRATARERMTLADRPALVFHAHADLAWAEHEVETLKEIYYGHAETYFREEDQPATPERVLDLLGGSSAAPASLVHLACHGLAGPDPASSALRLAPTPEAERNGATDAELTLSALLDTPHDGEAHRTRGPLVVCSACETDLTTRDHDEALTVTSALVHRLAADAIGSRWAVPDSESEVLMLVLHDRLAAGLAPPDALRAAQRWMLTPPDRRPSVRGLAKIAARRVDRDFRDLPEAWAAFVHQGSPAPAGTVPVAVQEGALA